jgi:anti-sigma regulatory factor (Ser/Thr protein kinase)
MDFNSEVRRGTISLHWQGEATPASVAVARRLARIFGVDHVTTAARLADLALAADEAMSRAVVHGYPDGERGLVALDVWVSAGELTIEVRDFGAEHHDALDDMGTQVMAAVSDRCTVADAAPGTRVTLAFAL